MGLFLVFFSRAAFKQRSLCTGQLYTAKPLHRAVRGAFTQSSSTERSLSTKTPLHRTALTRRHSYTDLAFLHRSLFARRSLNTEKLWCAQAFRQGLLFTDMSLHRRFYTEKPVHFIEALYTQKLYTEKPLHRAALHNEAFVQGSFYKQKLLHRDAVTQSSSTERSFSTKTTLHRTALTRRHSYTDLAFLHRSVCTEKLFAQPLQRAAFTHRSFTHRPLCAEKPQHGKALVRTSFLTRIALHRYVFTQTLLHREAGTLYRGPLHAEALHREAFAQSSFTQRSLCTEQLLQTEAFTQKRLHTEQLYREAFSQRRLCTEQL